MTMSFMEVPSAPRESSDTQIQYSITAFPPQGKKKSAAHGCPSIRDPCAAPMYGAALILFRSLLW